MTGMLSKSRYTSGLQCLKQLWWKVHEPEAPELAPDAAQQALIDQGILVGEVAREHVPGGVLISNRPWEQTERIAATEQAIRDGARIIYEAGLTGGGVFAAVDIMQRSDGGWSLVEVKSSTSVKPHHLPDLAVQVHAARAAGLEVVGAELMHLNRDCRHPELSDLFVRTNLLADTETLVSAIPDQVARQLETLQGDIPDVAIGDHCSDPHPCPFKARCWPELPAHHVSTLNGVGAKKLPDLLARGWTTIADIPENAKLTAIQARQRKAVLTGGLHVDPCLADELRPFMGPAVHLDFETVSPPIPRWPGTGPYAQVPVQASIHCVNEQGVTHRSFLPSSPDDPRPALAEFVAEACGVRGPVIVWNAGFERGRLLDLAGAVPSLREELLAIRDRVEDLMVPVKAAVAHPDFGGSFSLKAVGPVLVPGVSYSDLTIQDGETASRELLRLFTDWLTIPDGEREALRTDLLAYCERDTEVTVRLVERLRELAGL